jgi:hypothetical protein
MEPYEVIELKNDHVLHIVHDTDPESPRSWDNLGTMICVHRRYNLGDFRADNNLECLQQIADDLGITEIIEDLEMYEEIYEDEEQLQDWINSREDYVILPLYLYDHGGITMSTSSYSCRWDSGQVGYIYCPTNKILKEYGNTNLSTLTKVEDILEDEVKTYDQYLTGDVYGFELYKKEKCDLGHAHLEFIDSCHGFYGDDFKQNGIFGHIDSELIPDEYATTTMESH